MTISNTNTNLEDKLLDDKYLSRDLELIFDSIRDIHDLSNEDGLRLDSFNSILSMIIEKMANAFSQIESDLLMYRFSSAIREAQTDEEKLKLINEYQALSDNLPHREYVL